MAFEDFSTLLKDEQVLKTFEKHHITIRDLHDVWQLCEQFIEINRLLHEMNSFDDAARKLTDAAQYLRRVVRVCRLAPSWFETEVRFGKEDLSMLADTLDRVAADLRKERALNKAKARGRPKDLAKRIFVLKLAPLALEKAGDYLDEACFELLNILIPETQEKSLNSYRLFRKRTLEHDQNHPDWEPF